MMDSETCVFTFILRAKVVYEQCRLKNPCFVSSFHLVKEHRFLFDLLQDVFTHINLMLWLVIQYHFGAHFLHPEILSQEGSDNLSVYASIIRNHQSAIFTHQGVDLFKVCSAFRRQRRSVFWVTFSFFLATLKAFVLFFNSFI